MNWETGFSVLCCSLNSVPFSPFIYSHSRHTMLTGPASSATAFASTANATWWTPTYFFRPSSAISTSVQPLPTIPVVVSLYLSSSANPTIIYSSVILLSPTRIWTYWNGYSHIRILKFFFWISSDYHRTWYMARA